MSPLWLRLEKKGLLQKFGREASLTRPKTCTFSRNGRRKNIIITNLANISSFLKIISSPSNTFEF